MLIGYQKGNLTITLDNKCPVNVFINIQSTTFGAKLTRPNIKSYNYEKTFET